MKRLITALSIILALFLISPNISNAQQGIIKSDPFDIIISNAITSSVSIVMVDDYDGIGTCTGVVLKNTPTESIVLTAKHCLVIEGEMYIESLLVNSIGVSYKSDLAYLVLNKFIPNKTPVRLSNHIPKNKDKIIGIGFPKRKLYKTTGTIFSETRKKQYAMMKIIKGCSGGGVFNEYGELIGIMVSYYPGIGMALLVRLEDIHTIINVNKLLE